MEIRVKADMNVLKRNNAACTEKEILSVKCREVIRIGNPKKK